MCWLGRVCQKLFKKCIFIMQLQALLLISAQETCNQAKVNSKTHYQWKRMIWCAQNAVRPATHGEWFNAFAALTVCFSLQFSTQKCLEYDSFSIAWDHNNIQKHLRPRTSSFNNSTFKFCFKQKFLSWYHRVTRHPTNLCIKKNTFLPSPHHPKWPWFV